jgi:proteic killer suppression protein
VIRTFRHKGVERFFRAGATRGIQAKHVARLRRQLAALNESTSPQGMNIPGWRWHPLKGALSGHWAVWVDENWRLTFAFEGPDAILVDYTDYH